ncbi:MAG: prolyl oligopeptidase family serine peptidase [Clostridia bacterium]|nr:prolyl oligopeptidase family serine peptidase [Clostridia bacterium]
MYSQTQNEIIDRYYEILGNTRNLISSINSSEKWDVLKKQFIQRKKDSFFKETFHEYDLKMKLVSKYFFKEFKIENILLNSPLGLEVNITVFSPVKEGKYPGILELTGSSRKLNRHYWASAQTYAKAGYVVVLCDVIGFVSERNIKSDVFKDAPLGYLIGYNHINAYVADIRACLDYLDTRADVDQKAGYTATGVSLGGSLSIEAALHDDRIRFFAPVCCTMEMTDTILPDLYTISMLELSRGNMIDGIDVAERIILAAPKNCIIITGAKDEVFTPEITTRVFNKVKNIYDLYENSSCELFIDQEVGHLYSVEMVNQVVKRLNKFFKNIDEMPSFKEEEVTEIDEDMMKCYPDNNVTIYSMLKDKAVALGNDRKKLSEKQLRETALELLNLDEINGVSKKLVDRPKKLWVHTMEKFQLILNDKTVIPAIMIKRDEKKRRGLIVVDEKGMWNEIYQNGLTAKRIRFLNREDDENEPCAMTIDVAACGENAIQYSYNDIVEWADNERTLAYLSYGINKPLMGLMVRDIIASITFMRKQKNIDENDISIIGIGKCAIAALHATLIDGNIKQLELISMIDGYEQYFESYPTPLKQEIMIPDILKHYDLKDIIEAIKGKTEVLVYRK